MELQTLQIGRLVQNEHDLIPWAQSCFGSNAIVPNLHTTIAYSKALVDISSDVFTPLSDEIVVSGGKRELRTLSSGHLVLVFESLELQLRWKRLTDHGASWDHESFLPHVTLAREIEIGIEGVHPYEGDIVFGPEYRKKTKEIKGV